MANITSFGRADSLASGEVMIPLVVLKNPNGTNAAFSGFIPGFVMKNIVEASPEECLSKLKSYLTQKLKIMLENNEPFPFFPTRAEIMREFDGVHSIDFIKITSNARKSN